MYTAPPPGGGLVPALLVLGLAVASPWPNLFKYGYKETYLRWRDELFTLHYFLHHVLGPPILQAAGINFQELRGSSVSNYFVGYIFSSPMPWWSGDMLVYRMKTFRFIIYQSFLLLAAAPNEGLACARAYESNPKLFTTAFRGAQQVLRRILLPTTQYTGPADDPLIACYKVHSWLVIVIALLIPGCIIWLLEMRTWWYFLRCNPLSLSWPGGPTTQEISEALTCLKQCRARRKYRRRDYAGYSLIFAFLGAAFAWQVLDVTLEHWWWRLARSSETEF